MSKLKKTTHHVLVCAHKHCLKRGGREAGRELKRALEDLGLRPRVMLTAADCLDQCDDGPVVVVYPEGVWYGGVDAETAREIAARHVGCGRRVEGKVMHVLPGGGASGDDS